MSKLKDKRAQMFIEFMYYFGSLLFSLTLIYLISSSRAYSFVEERQRLAADLIAVQVKQEINYAVAFGDGYQRNFSLPREVLNREYSVKFENRSVRVKWQDSFVEERIVTENIEGRPKSGPNSIKSEEGRIVFG